MCRFFLAPPPTPTPPHPTPPGHPIPGKKTATTVRATNALAEASGGATGGIEGRSDADPSPTSPNGVEDGRGKVEASTMGEEPARRLSKAQHVYVWGDVDVCVGGGASRPLRAGDFCQ